MLGLATSQRAADVLAEQGVANTANLARFMEAQELLASGKVGARYRAQWQLRPGQLVVDEAGMTPTETSPRSRRCAGGPVRSSSCPATQSSSRPWAPVVPCGC